MHFLHVMFLGHPWYMAAIWGNVFVIVVLGPLGWLWSRTKLWPLNKVHKRIDELHARHDELRDLLTNQDKALIHTSQVGKVAQNFEQANSSTPSPESTFTGWVGSSSGSEPESTTDQSDSASQHQCCGLLVDCCCKRKP